MPNKVLAICLLIGMLLSLNAAEKPNILFIAIDDMNDWTTLFDKNNPIKTPNLERLAQRGTFFKKTYCASPGCNPSRTAILSGLMPSTSGVYSNHQSWKEEIPNTVILPEFFKKNNYATIGAGKIFHHGPGGEDRKENPSFDQFFDLKLHSHKPKNNYNGYKGKKYKGLSKSGWDWGEHDVIKQTDEYTVEFINKTMAEYSGDKPLFLAAGIFRPHLPFWAPPETFKRYPLEKVSLPPIPKDDLDDIPEIGVAMSRTQDFIWDNTSVKSAEHPGSLKKMVQSYQAAADYADQMVGRLLDQLDKSGKADNTIIVLWSDHGYHLGDKQATVKFTLWEKANHVPFIIVAPGVTKPGTVCDSPVSLVDIYPTLVELAGLKSPGKMDGQSLVPLLKNPKATWKRPALMTQLKGNHAVRTKQYRYIHYKDGTEELYDHSKDPWELINLAKNPEYASIIAEHKAWLPKVEKDMAEPKQKKK